MDCKVTEHASRASKLAASLLYSSIGNCRRHTCRYRGCVRVHHLLHIVSVTPLFTRLGCLPASLPVAFNRGFWLHWQSGMGIACPPPYQSIARISSTSTLTPMSTRWKDNGGRGSGRIAWHQHSMTAVDLPSVIPRVSCSGNCCELFGKFTSTYGILISVNAAAFLPQRKPEGFISDNIFQAVRNEIKALYTDQLPSH